MDALRSEFEEKRYFDVLIEYAKAGPEDIFCRIIATNRGPDPAPMPHPPSPVVSQHLVLGERAERPRMHAVDSTHGLCPRPSPWRALVVCICYRPGKRNRGSGRLLFTENETNSERIFGIPNSSPYVKDGIHEAVVHGRLDRVRADQEGSKVAAHFRTTLAPGASITVQVRFTNTSTELPFSGFHEVFRQRIQEADEFYAAIQRPDSTAEERMIQRQAFAGLLWSKQFYHYNVSCGCDGDPAQTSPSGYTQERPQPPAGSISTTWK